MGAFWLFPAILAALGALGALRLRRSAARFRRALELAELEAAAQKAVSLPSPPSPQPTGEGNAAHPRAPARPNDAPAQGEGQWFFALLEIDQFASLRCTVGFQIANQIMREVGARIVQRIGSAELGRSGGSTIDFIFNAADRDDAERKLEECLDAMTEAVSVSGLTLHLRCRVAFAAGDSRAVSEEQFDQVLAVLASAEGKRDNILFADCGPAPTGTFDELQILRALPGALAAGEVSLFYQPKFDCRDESFKSAEALLRWSSPQFGQVSPQHLVTLAERTGMIRDLSLWVLREAARDQARLRDAGIELTIFVNVSGLLLADRSFTSEALALIATAPGAIGIEITETAVIADPQAASENIAAYSAANVHVAIDDFGSGVSSLAYLKRLPVQELKIDKIFVDGLTQSHRDPLIVRSAIDLAHALEMEVTAEGVDDPMCFSLLRVMGCDKLQGYYIAKPMPLDDLVQFLAEDARHDHLASSVTAFAAARARA